MLGKRITEKVYHLRRRAILYLSC